MSYGPNFPDLFRCTADYVDKILRGVKPADIPVEQPTSFDFFINLKTAKALGLASAHAARPCLRGDRIAMHFAAVHEPCIGTSRRITFSMAMAAFGAERTCMGV
jgi:ABC transporter substrate binding protein